MIGVADEHLTELAGVSCLSSHLGELPPDNWKAAETASQDLHD